MVKYAIFARENEFSIASSCFHSSCLPIRRYFFDLTSPGHVRTNIHVSRTDSADGMEQLEQVWV